MKTIFDEPTRKELKKRLDNLNSGIQPLWGKMISDQMVKHCRLWEEMIHENKHFKRPLIGRLIGQFILKKVLQTPEFRKNSPTIPEMVVDDMNIDFDKERAEVTRLLDLYPIYSLPDNSFIHPFFGKMTREEIGKLAYLHLNHHLKQFGL